MQSGNIAAPFWSRMWLRSHSSRWQGKTSNKTNRSQLTESEAKHRPSKLFCIMTFGRHNDGRESTPRTTPAPPSVEEVWALALLSQRWASSQIGPVLLPWTSLPWLMSGTVTSNSRKWNITQSQQMERWRKLEAIQSQSTTFAGASTLMSPDVPAALELAAKSMGKQTTHHLSFVNQAVNTCHNGPRSFCRLSFLHFGGRIQFQRRLYLASN